MRDRHGYISEWRDDELINATRNAVKEACEEGAELVAASARRLVKKGSDRWVKMGRSGGSMQETHIKDQIDIRPSKFQDGGVVIWAQGKGNYDRYYASFLELGAWIHPYGNKNAPKVKLEKQPFLRPALAVNRSKIQQAFQDKLK